jgi:hypothetical protein
MLFVSEHITTGGVNVLHLKLWGKWVEFKRHPRYGDAMKYRGFLFTRHGQVLKVDWSAEETEADSDEFSEDDEPIPFDPVAPSTPARPHTSYHAVSQPGPSGFSSRSSKAPPKKRRRPSPPSKPKGKYTGIRTRSIIYVSLILFVYFSLLNAVRGFYNTIDTGIESQSIQ